MQLEFEHTWVLVLLPIILAVMIILNRKYSRHNKSRRIGEDIVRSIVMALIILAISGPSIKKTSDITTTIFLIDMSDSVKARWSEEIDFVKDAISKMPGNNKAGIVVFGGDAQIEQFVSDKKAFSDVQVEVNSSATDLEQAVSTAMALFPDDSAKRIVILSDGAENQGNLSDMTSSISGSDVEIKMLRYDSTVEKEVYVNNVELPEKISKGDKFQVKVDIFASESTNAVVSLYSGRKLKDRKEVTLQSGDNQLVFADKGVEDGIKSYRVTVEADKDTVTVNNTYSAFTNVAGKSKLLVIEGDSKKSKEFQKVLKAANYEYEVYSPSAVPNTISELMQYKSIVMIDVFANDLRKGFLNILEKYVTDYAGGLAVIGGENSYALGNYRNTPLETVLPVKMDLEGEKQIPPVAMVMVIDHSGSMMEPTNSKGGPSCLNVAKQAAVNAIDSLREIDSVGVLAFDDTYSWSVKPQAATDPEAIVTGISSIGAGGGTSIYPALEEAEKQLEKIDAPIKHIVLMTDGQDGFKEYDDLLKKIADNNITLSTVAVGAEADMDTLEWLSKRGGGRYYYSDAGSDMPRIFAQEVYLSTESYLVNEEFIPTITMQHEILEGVFDNGSPSLLGYVATTPKQTAQVLLESDKNDPILSCWQYGLGRTVAWTSDGTNKWTGNFAGWDNYVTLWRNIIDWTIANTDVGEDTVNVEQNADSAVITYETSKYDENTKVTAVMTDEEGNQQDVKLKAISPGKYQGIVPISEIGVYCINLRNQNGEELVKNINTATAMQYSKEYRFAENTGSIDDFINHTGGRIIETTKEVFDTEIKGAKRRTKLAELFMIMAILFFVLDIASRRMSIDWIVLIQNGFTKTTTNVAQKVEEEAEKIRASKDTKKHIEHNGHVEHNEHIEYKESIKHKEKIKHKDNKKQKSGDRKIRKDTQKKQKSQPTTIDTASLLKKKDERNL